MSDFAFHEGLPAKRRFRRLAQTGDWLITTDDGWFAISGDQSGENDIELASSEASISSTSVEQPQDRLGEVASAWRMAARQYSPPTLDYLLLVPTLRCNLSCSYCQVSRAELNRIGFDWSDEVLRHVLRLIDRLQSSSVKIEFQGGEPTLRPDLISAVIERCARFAKADFVICTNLEQLNPEIEGIFARPDVHISTSLDGDSSLHTLNRTGSDLFRNNLRSIIDRYGASKVSALPTLVPGRLPDADSLIDAYAEFGLSSIFLRPVSYHGFARKRHAEALATGKEWQAYHRAFVTRLIARNWERTAPAMEESYLSICLRRIVQPGRERHVDLRQPNPIGVDAIVIDYDGKAYPTDEARMLTRAGVMDLAIGSARDGWDSEARRMLDAHSTNDGDPTCEKCAFKPYCGRDLIDDIARYGRIDLPREETEFCQRHQYMFELCFELLHASDPATRYSVAKWLGIPGKLPKLEILQ